MKTKDKFLEDVVKSLVKVFELENKGVYLEKDYEKAKKKYVNFILARKYYPRSLRGKY